MPSSSSAPPLAVVTGGNGGIGFALAVRLAQAGHRLLIVARDEARLAEAAAALAAMSGATSGAPVETARCDLADPVQSEDLAARLSALEPDILVNNAGFGAYGAFSDLSPALASAMIATNVAALTRLTAAVLPAMRARGAGRILNVASTAAFAPVPFAAVYGASKAFVLSFSAALSQELEGTGITVTALCPGPTVTRFAERAGMTQSGLFQGPLASAEMVADQGFAALMAGRRTEVPGLMNQIMTLSTRFAPRAMVAKVTGRFMRERVG